MPHRIYPVFEQQLDGVSLGSGVGVALGRVVEVVPALAGLLDFYSADPLQMAREIGMVYARDEDTDEDLAEIDFGPQDWYEASAGIASVDHALNVLRSDSDAIVRYAYEPDLATAQVLADLEEILAALLVARQHEVRFHFLIDEDKPRRAGL